MVVEGVGGVVRVSVRVLEGVVVVVGGVLVVVVVVDATDAMIVIKK